MDDTLLAHVGGELVGLDMAQEVDRPFTMEGEDVVVEGLSVQGRDLAPQLGNRHEAALRHAPFAGLAHDVLEFLVIQSPLSVGQKSPLAGWREATPWK